MSRTLMLSIHSPPWYSGILAWFCRCGVPCSQPWRLIRSFKCQLPFSTGIACSLRVRNPNSAPIWIEDVHYIALKSNQYSFTFVLQVFEWSRSAQTVAWFRYQCTERLLEVSCACYISITQTLPLMWEHLPKSVLVQLLKVIRSSVSLQSAPVTHVIIILSKWFVQNQRLLHLGALPFSIQSLNTGRHFAFTWDD